MTQNEFFNILMDELKDLPELELQRIILFYKKILSYESSLNRNEEDIIKDFGDPYLICFNYKNKMNFLNNNIKNNVSSNNINLNTITKYNDNQLNTEYLEQSESDSDIEINNKTSSATNKILKFCILILSLIIFFPMLTTILGIICILISIFIGSITVLIQESFSTFIDIPNLPQFITNLPVEAVVLFALGSITFSIFIFYFFYYLFKFFFRLCMKTLKFLKP